MILNTLYPQQSSWTLSPASKENTSFVQTLPTTDHTRAHATCCGRFVNSKGREIVIKLANEVISLVRSA